MSPRRIALFFWLCIALLGVLCVVFPKENIHIGSVELRWANLASVLDLEPAAPPVIYTDSTELAEAIDLVEQDTLLENQEFTTNSPVAVPMVDIDTTSTQSADTRYYLRAFYTSLSSASEQQVRVVHYGDSQIEEDRMTLTVRRRLQEQYGGGGVGLIPLHQTIPTRTIHQVLTMNGKVQSVQQGPRRQLVYGPKSGRRTDGRYGVMGQVALMNDSLQTGSEQLTLTVEPMSNEKHTERYFSRLRMWSDGDIRWVYAGDTLPASQPWVLRDSTSHCSFSLVGRGEVYGISLETPTGVIVDNIPMRGCLGTVFTDISREQLTRFYKQTNTRLIIMQFGGNAIPFNEQPSTIRGIVNLLRKQVQYVHSCAPEASILFVGPGDMTTLIDGSPATYPLLPYMDRLLAQMAQQEHIGYYSLYHAMGGQNSMIQWQQHGWAGSDGVHFTRRGAEKAGEQLADWLLDMPDFPSDSTQAIDEPTNTNQPTRSSQHEVTNTQ